VGNRGEEIENEIYQIYNILEGIRVTDGFYNVLDENQQRRVRNAAIQLATAVTHYIVFAIRFLKKDNLGNLEFRNSIVHILVKKLFTSQSASVKSDVEKAANQYQASMGFLVADMVANIWQDSQNAKRAAILNWVWAQDYWQWHKSIRKNYVRGTGTWFLNSDEYKNWVKLVDPSVLICLGIRNFLYV
jgi:hypothetical protein